MDIPQGSALDRALHHDDMNAARELEEEIERRGLQRLYIVKLDYEIGIVYEGGGYNVEDAFLFIRATPEQRARAYLKAVGD